MTDFGADILKRNRNIICVQGSFYGGVVWEKIVIGTNSGLFIIFATKN